jgi:hypothetical protein
MTLLFINLLCSRWFERLLYLLGTINFSTTYDNNSKISSASSKHEQIIRQVRDLRVERIKNWSQYEDSLDPKWGKKQSWKIRLNTKDVKLIKTETLLYVESGINQTYKKQEYGKWRKKNVQIKNM